MEELEKEKGDGSFVFASPATHLLLMNNPVFRSWNAVTHRPASRLTPLAIGIATLLSAAQASRASLITYTPDVNTVHLYHLDELAGSVSAANSGTAGGNIFAVDENPVSTTPPTVTTVLGGAGFTGFGQAANFTGGTDLLLGYDFNNSGAYQGEMDNATPSLDRITLATLGIGGTSPFTLETMVNPGSTAGNRELIATDSSATTRGFQFRITTGGTTGQRLEFNLIGSAGAQIFADIPNVGTNAFATNAWFHAAFSFDGTNAQFYWTKVDPSQTVANALGSATPLTLSLTAGSINGPLIFGNEQRGLSGEGVNGFLDEIRISNVARAANNFIFTTGVVGTFWNVDANGNWATAANWTAGSPNSSGSTANFGGGGTEITAPRTITIDGTKTIGTLNFNNPNAAFTLASGTAGALSLDNGASPANVTNIAGNHTIAVPITLPAAGANFSVIGSSDKLSITNSISGTGTLTKSGAGTLEIGNGATSGSIGSADVTISSGTLAFNRSDSITIANNISGVGGSVAQNGTGTLVLTGINSFGTSTGAGVIVNSGTMRLGSATAFPNNAGVIANGGTFDLNGNSISTNFLSGSGASIITDSSVGAGTTSISLAGISTTDFFGSINNGATKVLSFAKSGTGTLRLRGASSYSGGTTFTQGFIEVFASNALGTGLITMNPSATANAANNTRLVLNDGVVLSNAIDLPVVQPGAATGAIQTPDFVTATLNGPVTINANPINGGHIFGPASSGSLNFNGPITIGGSATVLVVRGGRVQFAGGGSYPQMRLDAGTTLAGANNGLATNAVIDFAANATATIAATLDLNGFNQTLAGIQNTLNPANAALITSFGITTSTLTLDLGVGITRSYGGSISGDLGLTLLSGTQELTQTGTVGINGTYSFLGPTRVDGGKLIASAGLGGTSDIRVATGATLAGRGTFITTSDTGVVFASQASLEPGNGIAGNAGQMLFSLGNGPFSLAAAAGGTGYLKFDLDTPLTSDAVTLDSGILTLGSGGLDLDDFSFNPLGGFGPGTYTLFDTNSDISGTLGSHLASQISGFNVSLQFANGSNGRDDLILVVAVPEPGSLAALLGGTALLLGARRMRKARLM